jgi:uridine kinase
MSNYPNHDCVVIAISGGSGSGKSAITTILKDFFGDCIATISQDSYYNDLSNLNEDERRKVNFDHPDSLDFVLLYNHVKNLRSGLEIDRPVYCFKTHTRKDITSSVYPKKIIIIEGLYSFFETKIRALIDCTVYVEVSNDIRLIRRIRRDVMQRGRTVESVIEQYESSVRDMHIEYVDQQKYMADIIIENNGNSTLENVVKNLIVKINQIVNIPVNGK